MARVALGIAQGAPDDITVLEPDNVPMLSPVALGGEPAVPLRAGNRRQRAVRDPPGSVKGQQTLETIGDRAADPGAGRIVP
jgi:hypothetical protein